MVNLQFSLNSKKVTKFLIALILFEVFLVIVYIGDFLLGEPIWRIHELFDLDSEASIPTWFSIVQIFMIGFIALLVAYNQKTTPPPSKRGLTILGLGFIYLSLDEGASIHEKLTYEFHNHPWVPYFDGVHGIWIVVYGVIGIIVCLILAKDIISICRSFRKEAFIFIAGMIIYLAGTGGSEAITYFYVDKDNPLVYALEVCLEEFTEMLGASMLLYSMLLFAVKKLELTDLP